MSRVVLKDFGKENIREKRLFFCLVFYDFLYRYFCFRFVIGRFQVSNQYVQVRDQDILGQIRGCFRLGISMIRLGIRMFQELGCFWGDFVLQELVILSLFLYRQGLVFFAFQIGFCCGGKGIWVEFYGLLFSFCCVVGGSFFVFRVLLYLKCIWWYFKGFRIMSGNFYY